MRLYLAKPDLIYFEQFNEMMEEWCESGTQIAPWFLDKPFESIEKCGGIQENTVTIDGDDEPIRRYWIDVFNLEIQI